MPAKKFYPDKICKNCGALFNRTISKNGRLEGTEDFNKRKFCCYKCSVEYRVGPNHYAYKPEGSVRKDGYVRVSVRGERVYLHRLKAAELLGRELSANEHVHHIDNNPQNNDISNLNIVSNSEHLKTHYQKWLNEGRINNKGQFQ